MIETDPERPSTAVARDETISRPDGTTEVVSAASVGDARDTNPERLRRLLRGDLDAIVLKALRKEPQRRYPSAEALAQDIERYEEGQPVLAHRGSRTYRFGKLVRRHRAETALVAFVVAAVVGFALFSSAQARRLERERDRAQTEATKAEEVSAFLVSVFEQADPTATRGDTLTAREMLASGAARAETDLAGQPEVQATVLRVIAQAYRGLGREDRARPLFERAVALRREALGDDDPETLAALFDLGTVYEAAGEVELASSAFEEVLSGRRARLGDTHPDFCCRSTISASSVTCPAARTRPSNSSRSGRHCSTGSPKRTARFSPRGSRITPTSCSHSAATTRPSPTSVVCSRWTVGCTGREPAGRL